MAGLSLDVNARPQLQAGRRRALRGSWVRAGNCWVGGCHGGREEKVCFGWRNPFCRVET